MHKIQQTLVGFAVAALAFAVRAEIVDVESCTTIAKQYSYTATQTHQHSGSLASLFDALTEGTVWCADKPDLTKGTIPTVVINFASHAPIVNAYAITAFGSHGATAAPSSWQLSASNSPDGPWTVLDHQSGQVNWGSSSTVSATRRFTFVNATSYSCYKIEFLGQNGHKSYVELSELALLHARDTEVFESVSGGDWSLRPGAPAPGYAGLTGCKPGDVIDLSLPSRFAVNELTSRRYELSDWRVCDYSGTVLRSGTFDDLPARFAHPGDALRVVWNWRTITEDAIAAATTDITEPANAAKNAIKDNGNGGVSYVGSKAFDGNTGSSYWRVTSNVANSDHWVQYEFKTGAPVVTAFRAYNTKNQYNAYRLEASNTGDDDDWHELSSGAFTTALVQLDNHIGYCLYRFHISGTSTTIQVNELELYSYRMPDTIEVFGSPRAYGTPTPLYGLHAGLKDGEELACEAPSEAVVTAPGVRSVCQGYVLERGQTCVTNLSQAFTYTHGGEHARLTWLWSDAYEQNFSASDGGSVDKTQVFAPAGSTVTVTATGTATSDFAYWTGDVPEGCERQNPLVYAADRPRTMRAVFAAPVYVKPASEGGDDAADGLSWATAKATPTAALACDSSAVYLAPGVYEIAGDSLTVTRGILLTGGDDPAETVLRVLPDTLGTGAVLRIAHALARVSGLTIEGGISTDGFAAGLVMSGGVVSNCVIRNCRALSAGSKGGGVYVGGEAVAVGLTVLTNVTAGSGGGAYFADGGMVRDCRFEGNRATGGHGGGVCAATSENVLSVANCQFVGNAASGAGGGLVCMTGLSMRKSVVAKNQAYGSIADSSGAGGLQLYTLQACTVEDTVIEKNTASGYGGGLDSHSSRLTARRCVIGGNSGDRGGGVCTYHTGSGTLFAQLIVTNNISQLEGGGLFLANSELRDSLVTGNRSTTTKTSQSGGGGIEAHTGSVTLRNVTVVGNRAGAHAGGLHVGATTVAYNSIFWDNTVVGASVYTNVFGSGLTLTSSCTGDSWRTGGGCFSADPLFADVAAGNYTLRSCSPCVNAGKNALVPSGDLDLDGNPRIYNFGRKSGIVDLGCYESPWGTPGFQVLVR